MCDPKPILGILPLRGRRVLASLMAARRGNVAPLLAVAIIPLVAAVGLSVDGARGWLVKSRLSQAIDAAGLAGGRVISNAAKRDADIEMFFRANFPSHYMDAVVEGPTISVDDPDRPTTITIQASATIPTTFMRVLGKTQMKISAVSETKRTDRGMELVLVMDNTGSMSTNDRIGKMKAAATELVNILYGERETVPTLWVGLVPYVATVNIGAHHANWTVPQPAFSRDVDKMTLAEVSVDPKTAIVCVDTTTPFGNELRSGYIVDITGASNAKYNGRFMIRTGTGASVPPGGDVDDPGCPITSQNASKRFWYVISPTSDWYELEPVNSFPSSPATRAVSGQPIKVSRPAQVYSHGTSWKGCVEARTPPYEEQQAEALWTEQPWVQAYWPSTNGMKFYEFPAHEVLVDEEDDDLSRPGDNNWGLPRHPSDPTAAVTETTAAGNDAHGPNLGCGPAILPLQASKSAALAAIGAMGPWSRGGTMANLGLAWGWRVLSPNWQGLWGAPTPANMPHPYDAPLMDKVIILLTDGENQWYDYPDHAPGCDGVSPCGLPRDADYTAYGRLAESRLGTNNNNTAKTTLNNRMSALCEAIKDRGIIVYTIVVETPSTATNNLYSGCATTPNHYFPTPDVDDLDDKFKQIADQLANLRLAR